jgi:glycosyltransferase involved in cell wall biosynthesis
MGLKNVDIICLSTHYWDERRFRKQEFMSRFAHENRVLFVEPSISMARRSEAHLHEFATNRYFLSCLETRDDHLHFLKPPRGLPKWSNPRVERLNYRWFGTIVERAARRLGFRAPVLWIYRPSYYHALEVISHGKLVFDLVDDLSAYGGGHWTHVEYQTQKLVEASDLLVVTAKTLLERYESSAKRTVQISNGFDAELFSPELIGGEVPSSLSGIRRPILGFIGTLFSFIDFELLERVARVHHDKSLVLVGPVEASAEQDVAQLKCLPNVRHLGGQPQSDMPAFVSAFDICLNPFVRGRIADSVSPLKVYEYLAMGRPVVSTPMKALQMEDVARAVVFAEDADEFCEQIFRCLGKDVQDATEARREAVAPHSWEGLFERLDAACSDVLADTTNLH